MKLYFHTPGPPLASLAEPNTRNELCRAIMNWFVVRNGLIESDDDIFDTHGSWFAVSSSVHPKLPIMALVLD